MKKFLITAVKTVRYEVEVEAESALDARNKFHRGETGEERDFDAEDVEFMDCREVK